MTIPQIYVAIFCVIGIARELYLATGHGIRHFMFDVTGTLTSFGVAVYFLHVGGFW